MYNEDNAVYYQFTGIQVVPVYGMIKLHKNMSDGVSQSEN